MNVEARTAPSRTEAGNMELRELLIDAGRPRAYPMGVDPLLDPPADRDDHTVYAHFDKHDDVHTDQTSVTLPPQHTNSHLDYHRDHPDGEG
jgi:hypothetical protein